MPAPPRGVGALVTTETELVDLGRFGARELRARVERRTLRLALGRRVGVSIALGRLRPATVEVHEAGREPYDVAIAAPADPWLSAARRLALLWLASVAVTRLVGGRMRRRDTLSP